jgi:hypothetical protein
LHRATACYTGEAGSKHAKISAEARHDTDGSNAGLRKRRASAKYHYLKIVTIAEAAVVGAGVGVALIGAMEIATAIAAQQWLAEAKHYSDYAPLVGGLVGAIRGGWRVARRKRRTAAKIAGVSGHAVARDGAKLEGTSQIAKRDGAIGADSKARFTRKPSADVIPLSTPAKISR